MPDELSRRRAAFLLLFTERCRLEMRETMRHAAGHTDLPSLTLFDWNSLR